MEDMFLTQEKLEKRMRMLEDFRFRDMNSLAPFAAMDDEQGPDAVRTAVPEVIAGRSYAIGDEFVGRDRYLWIEKTVTLPPRREGAELYGLFDFGRTGGGHNSGFESLLYLDGQPFQGVDTNHPDVNFDALVGKTVRLSFMLWTGLEGGGPQVLQRHRFERADLGYLDKATDELYYFAKAISKETALLPDENPDKYALRKALNDAFNIIDWDAERFYETAAAALNALKAAIGGMEKRSAITVNCVGHTHIDVAWLWRLKHTREKALRSFSTVLKLMDEFDEYVFLQSEPQLYRYMEKDCPELFERIKRRVAEGRWEVDGGMWLEADCNLSSGEALVRQFLYGMRYIQKNFGRRCEYLWLPDVFGYSWALPQILKGCGIDTFMTTKISWNQFDTMPHDLFRWRGIDGSSVMAYFITTPEVGRPMDDRFATYNGMISPRSVLGSWKKFHDKDLSNETLLSYGYGDGGGGVNRNMLKMRRAMDELPGLPNVKTGRAGDFFRRLHDNIDHTDRYVHTWDGELYLEYHRGTYTSQGYNKKMNRRLEFALAQCEWLNAMSHFGAAASAYEGELLQESWETILRNQFHDIIPGSSIREVYEDCHREYGKVEEDLNGLSARALGALTEPKENAYSLYHFSSFAQTDGCVLPITEEGSFADSDGEPVPAQRTEGGYLVAPCVPALSLKTVYFHPGKAPEAVSPFRVDLSARRAETPYLIVEWEKTGALSRVYDRVNDREALLPGARGNELEFYEDRPLNHDNWDIDIYYTEKKENARLAAQPELVEEGPLRLVLRFRYAYRHSTISQDLILYAATARMDFVTDCDWHEDHRLFKVAFPLNLRATKASYDIQFGHVERPTHFNTSWDYARFEVVGHKWGDISETGYGASLLNDCKYGYSAKDSTIRLSLLKSGKYPDTQTDMGAHRFTYALFPHEGSVAEGETIEEAQRLNLPVRFAPGRALDERPFVEIDSFAAIIDAVKKSEDGDELIVRLHECRGGHAPFTLTARDGMAGYRPVNLLEEPAGEYREAEEIGDTLRPFEIKNYRIRLR